MQMPQLQLKLKPNGTYTIRRSHPKVKFTQEEDDQLRRYVALFGENNWEQVAACMPNRNQRQCRERWINYLSPNVNNSPWTPMEDDLLFQKHADLGAKWVQIARFFPGRSDTSVKNRWMVLMRRAKNETPKPTAIPVPVIEPVKTEPSIFDETWLKQESEVDLWTEMFANGGSFEAAGFW